MNDISIASTVRLNSGVEMPVLGLGTYRLSKGEETENAVKYALDAGYRLFDTASKYGNEESVGKALSLYGLLREEYFITTKVDNTEQGYENTIKALENSLAKLGTTHVDLYLVHWPSASSDMGEMINKREETWEAMEELLRRGKTKAIGVSNYTVQHLEEMKSYATVMPAVNQVEFHPFLYQNGLLRYCKENRILLEAYSPLTKGQELDHVFLLEIAHRYNKTPAQILLRWALQHGAVPIPKSANKKHIEENAKIFDFELTEEDMRALNNLNQDKRFGPDPSVLN